jgi:arabinose-5-phosphate isomerase
MIEARSIMNKFIVTLGNTYIPQSFPDVVESILTCKGKVITTGMGKMGTCMRNFSSLLCSLGTPSCYLHPGEASHGDLGIISKEDLIFVCSVSGKTREILETIDLARKLNPKLIIGMTSHLDSPVRKKIDLLIDMGDIREAGHLGIAPTSSLLVVTALTNCIALVVAKEKGFTASNYLLRHHSGYCAHLAKKSIRLETRDK